MTSQAVAPEYYVVYEKHHDGADGRNDHAVEVKSGYTAHSEFVEEPATDDCSDDSEQNVHNDAFSPAIDDLARDEPGNKSKDDPRNECHWSLRCSVIMLGAISGAANATRRHCGPRRQPRRCGCIHSYAVLLLKARSYLCLILSKLSVVGCAHTDGHRVVRHPGAGRGGKERAEWLVKVGLQ